MAVNKVSDRIYYVGVDDTTIDLFESQYPVPRGISYNSYVIMDEKIAVLDTVDRRASEEWLQNMLELLEGKSPDYLVVLHMEPDHAANLARFAALYPLMQVVGNAKTFKAMDQFFGADAVEPSRRLEVKEGDTLDLGTRKLQFFMAPMVHWPEVMVAYEPDSQTLFSADAFGRFGALSLTADTPWVLEARRYFLNIVGKYGASVQDLLQKLSKLEVMTVCPLHGPVLREELAEAVSLYDTWSSYRPEEPQGILVAYASIHGHTRDAAKYLVQRLHDKGADNVVMIDLCRTDVSYAVMCAFRYGKLVLACCTYEGGVFLPMLDFLRHLKSKNWQNRSVALMENGTWAPVAARLMRAELETMKDIRLCDAQVTLRSAMRESNYHDIDALCDELLSQ